MSSDLQPRRRMRVGFDARWYNDSGVGAYVSGLLGAMARMQDEFELVLYEDEENRVPLPSGLTLRRVPVKAKRYSAAEQLDLARHCRADSLDLFHSPFYVLPVFAPCPVVVTFHDLIPFLFPIYPWAKQALVRNGYRLASRKAAHIIADSQNTANDIEKILSVERKRISVVHLAPNDCYHPRSGDEEISLLSQKFGIHCPYVLVAGARNWRTKNLETALKVLECVREQSRLKFDAVAYGSPEGIRSAAGESALSLNLNCTGYIAAEELAMLYRHASAFILPSLYEGFGLPLLEAMSCGCPVITTTGGALPEVAGNGAQVFDPRNVPGMADALCRLLCHEDERNFWRKAALARAQEFSWARAARETVSVYYQSAKMVRSSDLRSTTKDNRENQRAAV
ncbi:MAG: glycosyltransferase family 4 protein [Actinomycetota bacterium]